MNKTNTVFRLILLIGLGWLSMAQVTHAQQVSGTVTDDANGEALPGVNISVKGTTNGTFTDNEGHYTLEVPSLQDTMVFSFVGYQTRQVPINSRTNIDVTIQQQALSGEELVVVGYSTQKKKDLTGSVSVVNVDEITKLPEGQLSKQLQGQASGVTVISSGQPGESPTVRIRGINTFGNNEPLFVVDGVPTQNIDNLNPENVKSMQVLKDAAAASIYGSRASNGVIIITTKQGQGNLSVKYDSYVGIQTPPSGNVWNLLSAQGMADLKWKTIRNSGGTPGDDLYGFGDNPVLPDYITPLGASEGDPEVNPDLYNVDPNYTDPSELNNFYRITRANRQGTNWFQEIFDPAVNTNQNLSISGGGDRATYLFSLNYLNQQGTLKQTFLKRYTLRLNTQFDVSDNIRMGENLAYSASENPQVALSSTRLGASNGPIGYSFREQPIIPVKDIMGNYGGTYGTPLGNSRNPVADLYNTRNNRGEENRLFGNLFAELDVGKNLTARTSFGGTLDGSVSKTYRYPDYENAQNITTTNEYIERSNNTQNWTWTNTVTYHQTFNDKHDLKIVAGTEVNKQNSSARGGSTQDYFAFNPDYVNLSNGSGTKTNFSFERVNSLFSLFGRLDYSYDNKYLISATIRRDGSSKFLNNRYGLFPAGSVGWRISQEKFMKDIKWLDDLKLRASYGIMGNQLNVSLDNAYTLFGSSIPSSYYDINGTSTSNVEGIYQTRIGNPDAKWEQDKNFNIGFDATLFKSALNMTVDYYRKDILDLLYNPQLIATGGTANPPFVNVANIKNSGLDASFIGSFNISKKLNFNTTLTFTTYKNKITRIAEGVEYFSEDARRFGTPIIRNAVGHAISSFYGYNIIGFWNSQGEINEADNKAQKVTGNSNTVYQNEEGIGRFRYEDINNDGQITSADRTFLGSPNPDFSYGLNLGFNYENFDFTLFLYGVQGSEIWNNVKWWTDFYSSFSGAKSKAALYDSWSQDHKNASVSIQENESTFSTNAVPNSYYVENGAYLRAKNVQLGYTLPSNVLSSLGMEKLRVYVQAINLFTITNYSGIDPELSGSDDTTSFGIDEGTYPNQRQFLLGINLQF